MVRERPMLDRCLVGAQLGVVDQIGLGGFAGAGLEIHHPKAAVSVALKSINAPP